MKLMAILLLLLVLPVAVLAQTQEPAQSPSLVFAHVVVIDATGAPAQSDMTVVITKGHITALGKTDTVVIPQEAHLVDASGKFLIPGLWDMHVHMAFDFTPGGKDISLPLFIANGITGVRDMGGDLAALQQWRQQITQGTLIGPQIMASGPMLDGEFAPFPNSLPIATAAEGQEAVGALKRQGADFIKIQSLLPRDAYFAVAAEAKKQGLLFAGHVPDAVSAGEASDAGQRSMEHLNGIQFQNANDPVAVQLFTRFVKNGTWQCPTLVMRHNQALLAETDFRGDPRMKYIPGTGRWPPEVRPGSRVVYQQQVAVVGAMHKAGVRLLAGTDTAGPYIFPGFSLHEELELLVQAGLTPLEALQTATRNPAQYFGMSERFGTIQQEKVADLVLLDANPLEEISNTKRIAAVVVGGKLFTKDALQQMLANVEAAANKREFGRPLADHLRPMSYPEIQSLVGSLSAPGRQNYWKSSFMTDISDDAIETLVAYCTTVPSPLTQVVFQQLGNAANRVRNNDTAFSHREARYELLMGSVWLDPADYEVNVEWTRRVAEAMAPFTTGRAYVNQMGIEAEEGADRVKAAYGSNYDRLVALKNTYDPTNLFRLNPNIKPTG